jgi:hypothetical protein
MRVAPAARTIRAGGSDKPMNYEVGAVRVSIFDPRGHGTALRCCAAATPPGGWRQLSVASIRFAAAWWWFWTLSL